MNNSGTGMILYSKLIDRSDHTTPSDNDSLLDDAFTSLGTAALYCKDTNTALLNYAQVKSPQGPYQQCKVKEFLYGHCNVELLYCVYVQVYLMMSEKCCADEPHKSCGLLEKANSCIEQAIQRACNDDDESVCIIIAASFHSYLVILYSGKCLKLSTLKYSTCLNIYFSQNLYGNIGKCG